MRLLLFCENANQVYMFHSLCSSEKFPDAIEPEILILDWDDETTRWVTDSVSKLGWTISVTNIFEEASQTLKRAVKSARAARDRKAALVDLAFDYLKRFIGRRDVTLAQFNDASLRGSSIASTCRNAGLQRILIQDGFLNFVSKSQNLKNTDQNYNWGSTHPEYVAVWGDAMKDALIERHKNSAETITVTGPLKSELSLPERVEHTVRNGVLRVLWADQAIIDQGKARVEEWLGEFGRIAEVLSKFQTTLRLHPSTKESTLLQLEQSAGHYVPVYLNKSPKMSQNEILEYDVVVTYYSTIFLDCIANNIPCVIYRPKSVDIQLPVIGHPLLFYCDDLDALGQSIRTAASLDINVPTPPEVGYYLSKADAVAAIIGILNSAIRRPDETGGQRANPVRMTLPQFSSVRRLTGKTLLVIGGSFGEHIGVGKPIKAFADYIRQFDLNIEFHLATAGDRENLLSKVAGADIIIINSFDVVRRLKEDDLLDVYRVCELTGAPIVFYCHETQYVFKRLKADAGGRVDGFINNVLPHAHVLAVSDRQADWLSAFECRSIRTVYNSFGQSFAPVERAYEAQSPIILMVGTQQRRKGLDLFSRVADLAFNDGRNWRFVWLGGHTASTDDCYLSGHVDWRGHVSPEDVRSWLSKSCVFFLSSIDDPMPLGVGEALMSGVPCLTYIDTGFSDFITLTNSGEVFTLYDPEVAYRHLSNIVKNPEKYTPSPAAVEELIGFQSFGERTLNAIGEVSLSAKSDLVYSRSLSGKLSLHRILKGGKRKRSSIKWRVLYWLEDKLPPSIVKPGERMLKFMGIIGRRA